MPQTAREPIAKILYLKIEDTGKVESRTARLRALLKVALRAFGFKCLPIKNEENKCTS